jgi:hypothetical protein
VRVCRVLFRHLWVGVDRVASRRDEGQIQPPPAMVPALRRRFTAVQRTARWKAANGCSSHVHACRVAIPRRRAGALSCWAKAPRPSAYAQRGVFCPYSVAVYGPTRLRPSCHLLHGRQPSSVLRPDGAAVFDGLPGANQARLCHGTPGTVGVEELGDITARARGRAATHW